MFFDNIRLYLEDASTGKLKVKFVCKECGKEMDKAENGSFPCWGGRIPLYHEAEFICNECKKNMKAEF